ncbi:MAG TPA: oligopeptide:H+ symporter [Burkholderiales bacterium]|nr:oligopeptide:H+ symporter [Burkholderiales bacterium]
MSTATATERSDKMPAGIPFIIVNEFAERFCFYGINSILVVYMIQFLHFGDAKGQAWGAMFKSTAYFFPLLGAMVADIFLAKFRTIIYFSLVYVTGCVILALGSGEVALIAGLFLVAFGTGGIKPCVSTNVGDQFTSRNQHLIERAFSYFYFSINAGSSISIYFCPELLNNPDYGPKFAFGMPAVMMAIATLVFWLGRKRFAVVPAAMQKPGFAPLAFIAVFLLMLVVSAGVYAATRNYLLALFIMLAQLGGTAALVLNTGLRKALPPELVGWLERSFTGENLRIVGRLSLLYIFIAIFWALWDQSNGNSWTVQAQSALMDKHLFGFLSGIPALAGLASYEMLPAQLQVVNGLYVLLMIPIFTFIIYPLMGKFFEVTPLRKIGMGFFVCASSFLLVAWVEDRIQSGYVVSLWWQIAAYGILTASEILVSITGLEYSYKQAPPVMKSSIMSLFLLSTSVGNALTATVNEMMVRPLHASAVETGAETWVTLDSVDNFVTGQKIDFGGANGLQITAADGKAEPLAGTFLIGDIDTAGKRLRLMDKVDRKPVSSSGAFDAGKADVSTYALVGPVYFLFFAALMAGIAVVFIVFAMRLKEKTFVREDGQHAEAASETPPA